jgi:hypothetical protein
MNHRGARLSAQWYACDGGLAEVTGFHKANRAISCIDLTHL